ncbi:amine oxidase, flavin-containing [Lentisphaera araneosa HTCC2155]|uniref:Amine oxidase, flavin-containing n=1 Tax=Lentisphaera araneosa HTCC2155 TaxID=313628 RepID=A6DK91_9BACT|nr:FAD-dependent oxidoreductase [Lentisphaera araneosa]EDM27789.1 amine oxidase, flavin-containing [Lentisphaera araneosa HTCC2155]
MKKIAIIGTGISALTTAYKLHGDYEVHLYDKADYIGGHTNTIQVPEGDKTLSIDTGFIVFNDWTYPEFIKLMDELGVESQFSDMSFSVKCEDSGLEYNGTNTNSLFAQRRNILNPKFWKMIKDILDFNKAALQWLESADESDATSLAEFIQPYGAMFKEKYLFPMTAAIWSAGRESVEKFPLRFYLNFFKNHGFLSVDDRPVWRVIKGGSNSYVEPLSASFKENIHLNCAVRKVERFEDRVELTSDQGKELFDGVVFACHSDQALKILEGGNSKEAEILGAIPYDKNTAILHWDEKVLPKRKLAHAAWNYHLEKAGVEDQAKLTYNMNILQSLDCEKIYNVSLNYDKIEPEKIIKTIQYSHPVFTLKGVEAQMRKKEICGHNRSFFAGAYWRFGFHEDGVMSGLDAAERVREVLPK